jgi:hypothetical protein
MNDPEKNLGRMIPAAPSENFERRMSNLFEANRPRPRLWQRRIAAWQAVAACVFCSVGGFGASVFVQEPAAVPEPSVQTEHRVHPPQPASARSAFDLTDPSPFKSAASPPIQVVIENAKWER